MPSELDQQRRPTDWRRWNKTRLYLDDDAYDEHASDGADEDEADEADSADEDEDDVSLT